jgi:20S proteasome alpha/beta subunit
MNPRPRIQIPLRRQDKAVTITIGFLCKDGVLLCADTKHSGQMVLYDPKLFPHEFPSGAKSAFSISGNTAFAKLAVDKCQKAIEKLAKPTVGEMAEKVEKTLLAIHKSHIYPHPDRNMEGGPDFWMLVALWSPIDGLGTYYTAQTSLVPFDLYHCAGSGEYLAHYIIKPRYQNSLATLNTATAMACTALMSIKSYDANCGGNSEFVLLTREGFLGEMRQFSISETEKFSERFQYFSGLLLSSLIDTNLPDNQLDELFQFFKDMVLPHRQKYKSAKDAFHSLANALSKPKTKDKAPTGIGAAPTT